jgi:hypothetical protein
MTKFPLIACDHNGKWHELWMKKKHNKIQIHSLTNCMCIVICDYHATIFASNKNEWHVAIYQHLLLF